MTTPPLLPILPLLLLLVDPILPLPPAVAQSFVGGDLSNQAPFDIPAQTFSDATSNPSTKARFPIEGYNTSSPAGATNGTGTTITGWYLGVSVAGDVSLAEANTSSTSGNKDKSLVTEATTLTIVPPQGIIVNNASWRLCAVVFTGGLSPANTAKAQAANLGGGCEEVLPTDCIKVVQVQGSSLNGSCEAVAVPDQCSGQILGNSSAYELTSGIVSANRFFAAGSAPTTQGNTTALSSAQSQVWPILLTWTHFASSAQVHDSAGWLSCVKAPNSTSGDSIGLDTGVSKGVSLLAVLFSAALTGWMLL